MPPRPRGGAAFDQSTNDSANEVAERVGLAALIPPLRRAIFSLGGEGGIRTHGELAPTAVFKTAALNHSATSPICPDRLSDGDGLCKARDECNGRRAAWRLA
jgi:hypothetical protein